MELCDYKYSFHHIEGILQVLHKSTATSNGKKMFQRLFSTIQPSNSSSSEGEEVKKNKTLSDSCRFRSTILNETYILRKN